MHVKLDGTFGIGGNAGCLAGSTDGSLDAYSGLGPISFEPI